MLNSIKCSSFRELGRPYPRGFDDAMAEDALLDSQLGPKPLSLPASTKTTFFMAVSPDGKLLASAHGDHCVYVCEILTGKVLHRLAGHPRSPWALAFHPIRDDLLASGCLGGEVRVWDLKTGCSESLYLDNEDAPPAGPSTTDSNGASTIYTASVAIASVAFHPDERLLAVAAGDRLIFWDWSYKYPRGECRTGTPRERVRYVNFDRTGVLYTGITNSRQLLANTSGSSNNETEPPRPAMASTPPEVMPHRCRELLTSRNEILQMRAELSRRHEQLLQRYNDLLRRYQELRDQYPEILPPTTNPRGGGDQTRPILPPPPSPPPPAPRQWLDEATSDGGGQRFVNLMEENRRLGNSSDHQHRERPNNERAAGDLLNESMDDGGNEETANRRDATSPILLERLDQPESYAHEMTNSSLQQFERRHNLSYDRLCRSYRAMSESAQRLVMEFQRVYGEYISMKAEVLRRTGATTEPVPGVQLETGRAVLSTLAQMQVIMLSGDVPPTTTDQAAASASASASTGASDRPPTGGGIGQWSEERRMHDRILREARTLTRVHDLLLNLRNRLDFQGDVVADLRRGRERLGRLILELSRTTPGDGLEALHQRLLTEIRHFKLFIRQWKQVVMSNLTTGSLTASSSSASTAVSSSRTQMRQDDSAGSSSFVRLSLSPEPRSNEAGGASSSATSGGMNRGGTAGETEESSSSSSTSRRVANVFVSPLKKRPSTNDSEETSGASSTITTRTESMTSIRLPPPVVNLSPSRTRVESPGPNGGTLYRYSYPYSPPHRPEDRPSSSQRGDQPSDGPIVKRRRLNFGQLGEGETSEQSEAARRLANETAARTLAEYCASTLSSPDSTNGAVGGQTSATSSTSSVVAGGGQIPGQASSSIDGPTPIVVGNDQIPLIPLQPGTSTIIGSGSYLDTDGGTSISGRASLSRVWSAISANLQQPTTVSEAAGPLATSSAAPSPQSSPTIFGNGRLTMWSQPGRSSVASTHPNHQASTTSAAAATFTQYRSILDQSSGEQSTTSSVSTTSSTTAGLVHDLNRTILPPTPPRQFTYNPQYSGARLAALEREMIQSSAASTTITRPIPMHRRERPNIVLYVPRESSRVSSMAAAAAGTSSFSSSSTTTNADQSSDQSRSSFAGGRRRYMMVGSPPRFERISAPNQAYAYRGLTSSLLRRGDGGEQRRLIGDSQQEPYAGFTGLRNRQRRDTENPAANNNNNNNNDDEWEYSYDLNRAVNRAIAGAFIGAGDMALANNILDMTCRIQRWSTPIENGKYPDLTRADVNVVVSKCKLHNDGSVSINESGTLLAAFVENSAQERTLWAHTTLKIVSLRPEDRGTVLYEKTFGPNAISVSFSPADGRHVLIGLASRRYLRLRHSPQTCAMIFSLRDLQDYGRKKTTKSSVSVNRFGEEERRAPGELKLVLEVEHDQRQNGPLFGNGVVGQADDGSNVLTWGFRVDSVNCATWLSTPGQGLCYGTNRGQVYLLTLKQGKLANDDTDSSSSPSWFAPSEDSPSYFAQNSRRRRRFPRDPDDDDSPPRNTSSLISGNGNLIV